MKINLKKVYNTILDLLFPPKCCACGDLLDKYTAMCTACIEKYTAETKGLCKKCENIAPKCTCVRKINGIRPLCRTFYRGYDDESDRVTEKLMFKLKRVYSPALVEFFARDISAIIMKYVTENSLDTKKCVITYPPRSSESLYKYDFDHAEKMSKKIESFTGIKSDRLLSRKGGEEQKTLSSSARRENALNTMFLDRKAASAGKIKGKTVFLFDDIITTGATLEFSSELLLCAGAEKVIPVVIAVTSRDSSNG